MSGSAAASFHRAVLPEHDAEGWLAIDRIVQGRSFGGLRIVSELDEAELVASARTMTLKYAFSGLAMGGAKAALRLPAALAREDRQAALAALGVAWQDQIKTGRWTPAIDMGSDLSDLRALLAGAQVDLGLEQWRERSNVYTAWSVLASVQAACRVAGIPLAGARVLLEGYGRVGGSLAPLLVERGARLVGVSTRAGAFVLPSGIDVSRLEQVRATRGDRCVEALDGVTAVPLRELLLQDAEIAIPCARANAIDTEGAERLVSPVVVCAANAPLTRDVERRLFERGVVVVPDFVANAGGIVGSVLERYAKPRTIRRVIEKHLDSRVVWLLEQARATGVAPVDIAEQHAMTILSQSETGSRRWPGAWGLAVAAAAPGFLRDAAARFYARARLYPT